MPMQWTWKKMINGALAVALLTGSAAATFTVPQVAAAEEDVQERPFTDVRAGHWAEKHITKLELQGIINGYETADKSKEFRPNSSVTQQEAVVMAIRFAGLSHLVGQAGAAGESADMVVPPVNHIRVNAFAEDYVELAFEKGLLDREQENDLAAADIAADEGAHWGSKPASREWVTKLIVKSINQEAAASQLENAASSFFDAGSIDNRYKGYVNAAVQLGLVTGVTPNTFEPKSPVNRASLATLFSRAQVQFPVSYSNQVTGIITGLADDSIKVYAGGVEYTYDLNAGTSFFHYGSELLASKDQLIEYGDVTVIEASGTAKYVEVLSDKVHTETSIVTFDRLHSTEQSFYAWLNIDDMIQIEYEGNVVVEDTEGNPLTLSQLKRDSVITIVRDSFRASPKVIKIVVSSSPIVTSIKGTLVSVINKRVTIGNENVYTTKDLAQVVEVSIDGLSNASVEDLIIMDDVRIPDQVELTLNDAGQVIKIKVLNREIDVLAGLEIYSFDKEKKFVVLVDGNDDVMPLTLTNRTTFHYMDETMTLDEAATLSNHLVHVLVHYSNNHLVSMRFVLDYTGTITNINTTDKLITLSTADDLTVTMPYADATVSTKIKTNAAIQDLRVGNKIKVDLRMNQFEMLAVHVYTSIQYEVVSVDSVGKKIKLKNADISEFELNTGDIDIFKADGTKGFLTTLKPGSKVNIHYIGTSIEKIQFVDAVSNG